MWSFLSFAGSFFQTLLIFVHCRPENTQGLWSLYLKISLECRCVICFASHYVIPLSARAEWHLNVCYGVVWMEFYTTGNKSAGFVSVTGIVVYGGNAIRLCLLGVPSTINVFGRVNVSFMRTCLFPCYHNTFSFFWILQHRNNRYATEPWNANGCWTVGDDLLVHLWSCVVRAMQYRIFLNTPPYSQGLFPLLETVAVAIASRIICLSSALEPPWNYEPRREIEKSALGVVCFAWHAGLEGRKDAMTLFKGAIIDYCWWYQVTGLRVTWLGHRHVRLRCLICTVTFRRRSSELEAHDTEPCRIVSEGVPK